MVQGNFAVAQDNLPPAVHTHSLEAVGRILQMGAAGHSQPEAVGHSQLEAVGHSRLEAVGRILQGNAAGRILQVEAVHNQVVGSHQTFSLN